jgi:SnoaL-like domain
MNQHASNTPPSVGTDVRGIETLLRRNLPEVFGEGDPARRRAAIRELYTEDCVLYAPPGILVGHDALDKFAGDLRATHPHFVYTPHGAPQALHNSGRLGVGLWTERRGAGLHRRGLHRRTRRQDRSSLCLPGLAARISEIGVWGR